MEGRADDNDPTSSYVLGTLALEDAIKVRASIARRDAGGMGRRKSQTLGEPEKLSSLSETKSLSSILGCEEKTEISSPSRINWTFPPTPC